MSKRKAVNAQDEWKQNPMQAVNNHKFLNDANDAVVESLLGFVQAHPNCQLLDGLPDVKVVVRANTLLSNVDKNKVALISGGGSGHEPAHAGFVGEGMLNAAVCGDVFASPSVKAVLAAIRHVCGPNGCLLIVKNYTGDRLNFGLAAERAKLEGYKVEMVVVGDDCALPPPLGVAGRRGLAGTLFVHKVAGAAANSGLGLTAVKLEAMQAAACVGTVGVAVAAHTLPGASAPARTIPPGKMELGLGIHGEPGAATVPVTNVEELVGTLLEKITDTKSGYMKCLDGKINPPKTGLEKVATTEVDPPKPPPAPKVAVMINSLGATPSMELHVAAKAAREWLKNRGLNPARVYVGSFMTALNMTGFSVTLLSLDQQRLQRLDADVVSAAWPLVARAEAKMAPMPEARDGGGQDAEVDRVAFVQGEAREGRHGTPQARDMAGWPRAEVRHASRHRAARRREGAHGSRHESRRRRLRRDVCARRGGFAFGRAAHVRRGFGARHRDRDRPDNQAVHGRDLRCAVRHILRRRGRRDARQGRERPEDLVFGFRSRRRGGKKIRRRASREQNHA
jgi:dihydroxyacetone kinase